MAESVALPARATPTGWVQWLGQLVLYGAFGLFIGAFSQWPPYRHLPPDGALIKLSMVHSGKPRGACRERSAEELASLPPNMRAPVVCPRERSPVTVELDIDGQAMLRAAAEPSGLSEDGASALYVRVPVAAGERSLAVRLNDDVNVAGFPYHLEQRVELVPGQVLIIDFDAERGGIVLQ